MKKKSGWQIAVALAAAGSVFEASAGVPEGMEALAKRNFDEARRQFDALPADQEALYQLGRMANFGLGQPVDLGKANQLYGRAWALGHRDAGLVYARMLVAGAEGIAKDEAKGVAILKQLAEAGMLRAQYLYGWTLELGTSGVVKDEAGGVEWLRKAMEGGDADALVRYANAVAIGRGVPKDEGRAFSLLEAGADKGEPAVIIAHGRMFALGKGTAKDEAEALRHYKKAADLGSPAGQYEVGAAYVFGNGVGRDPQEGARWIDVAARNGDVRAQFTYGELFRTGTGVPRNLVQAFKWFQIAYDRSGGSHVQAGQNRATLASRMTTAQIEDASQLAKAYRVENGVRPVTVKLQDLARGDRFDIGGRTLYASLPQGYVNSWEIAERMRQSRPNSEASWADTILVAMATKTVDRLKMGLRPEEFRMLEISRYPSDDKVTVSADLFADLRKAMRDDLQARQKNPAAPVKEKILRDDERAIILLQVRPATGTSTGESMAVGLLRLNERAVYIRSNGLPGTSDGESETGSIMNEWVSKLLRAN